MQGGLGWADAVDFNLTGLSRGGQQIQKSRDTYVKAVGTLVELASLQVSPSLPLLDSITFNLFDNLQFEGTRNVGATLMYRPPLLSSTK